MSEENNNTEDTVTENTGTTEVTEEKITEGTVEIPWENVQTVLFNRGNLSMAETQLGQLTAEFERRKAGILRNLGEAQTAIQNEVQRLRSETNISEDVDCYLNLPDEEGGSAKFVIRDFDEETSN